MMDWGQDLLSIDATGAAAAVSVELTSAYDTPTCGDAGCQDFELRVGPYALPSVKTTYVCYQWPIPAILQSVRGSTTSAGQTRCDVFDARAQNEIVRIDPIVENSANVHHVLVMIGNDAYANGVNCPMNGNVIYAWAVGIEPFKLPAITGLPISGNYITLQMHYDNAKQESGIVDTSGLKFYVAQARQQQAALLWLGARRQRAASRRRALTAPNRLVVAGRPAAAHAVVHRPQLLPHSARHAGRLLFRFAAVSRSPRRAIAHDAVCRVQTHAPARPPPVVLSRAQLVARRQPACRQALHAARVYQRRQDRAVQVSNLSRFSSQKFHQYFFLANTALIDKSF